MLKASYEVLQLPTGHSFLLKVYDELAFTAPYHFHPEYELTLITGGSGKRYTGHHIADFSEGDLVLIGPDLPHCWKLESPPTHQTSSDGLPGAIVVQFTPDFLGKEFFLTPEFNTIRQLLRHSACGIQFPPTTLPSVRGQIQSLVAEKNDFKRLIGLLEILQELALISDHMLLDTGRSTAALTLTDQERIHPIFAYLVENFRGEISLTQASASIGMTPNAFCRYFKKITRKTFMETVIEYRLNYATRQLIQTDKPISAICFESGFGDISHFYKMFRSKMQLSPSNYRRQFMQETTNK